MQDAMWGQQPDLPRTRQPRTQARLGPSREGGSWAARLLSRGVWLIFEVSLRLPDRGYLDVLGGAGAEAGAGERKPREASEVAMLIRGGGRRGAAARSCGHQELSSVCEGREA